MSASKKAVAAPGCNGIQAAVQIHQWWADAARGAGVDLSAFNPSAPLEERRSWAASCELEIAGVLTRQSTKDQRSLLDQARECAVFAARNGIYVAPEYVCGDEQSGRKSNRDGLNRMREILKRKAIQVLLLYKTSRLFRWTHKTYAFIKEEVVEEGMRVVAVTQALDTDQGSQWGIQALLNGYADESFLIAHADHVRTGQMGAFLQGYVTGATPVGYVAVEAPGGSRTKLGAPRRKAQVDPRQAALVRQAFEDVRDGLPLQHARRRWLEAGGPADPRSTTGVMTDQAFRRLLSNRRYMGEQTFGRMRSKWSTKKDYALRFESPKDQVKTLRNEELRIVSDELFFAVQSILNAKKLRPRGPRPTKAPRLWDLVVDVFHCACCEDRYYSHGGQGRGMICKNLYECPYPTTIVREEAVRSICRVLADELQKSDSIVAEVLECCRRLHVQDDGGWAAQEASIERRIAELESRLDDMRLMAGIGSPEQRKKTMAVYEQSLQEQDSLQQKLAAGRSRRKKASSPPSAELLRGKLADLESLMTGAADGSLEPEAVYRAAAAFRILTGGRIEVHVEPRPGRKWPRVYGVFQAQVLHAFAEEVGDQASATSPVPELKAWLRKRPVLELMAERVHQLMDVDGLSYRAAAEVLQSEGYKFNSGKVHQIRERYYEMIGQPFPVKFRRKKKPGTPDSQTPPAA